MTHVSEGYGSFVFVCMSLFVYLSVSFCLYVSEVLTIRFIFYVTTVKISSFGYFLEYYKQCFHLQKLCSGIMAPLTTASTDAITATV